MDSSVEFPAAVETGTLRAIAARMRAYLPHIQTVLSTQKGAVLLLSRSAFDPRQFSKPADRAEIVRRLTANASQFKILYLLVFVACLVHTILSSPWLLVGLLVVLAAWAYAFALRGSDAPLDACGIQLRRREKLVVLVPFTVLVVTVTGMVNSLLYVLCCTSLVSVPHASFHESQPIDALDPLLEGFQAMPGGEAV
uniref:PRA1 family protein n=1 Tax=Calcidiscus leptoporus TaxID=127549 RepID=A0A7S0JAL5_9EUKA